MIGYISVLGVRSGSDVDVVMDYSFSFIVKLRYYKA
jgi:hypothetical protein